MMMMIIGGGGGGGGGGMAESNDQCGTLRNYYYVDGIGAS
jgi:hypothetical protein